MPPSLEQRLAAVRKGTIEAARTGLRDASGIVVAAAATLASDERFELVPELVEAFARMADKKIDPGCRAKLAIAHALHALDRWDDRVFVVGLSIVQLEGSQPPDDTAAPLRGLCGIAHAHANREDALVVLAVLLADNERATRLGAAQGLGDSGKIGATALLRYKILVGDVEAEVTAACIEAVLALDREGSSEFLFGLLARYDELSEIVVLALGGARLGAPQLIAWSESCRAPQRQRVAYLALALLRDDAATAHLITAIRDRSKHDAIAAARALATFKGDKLAAQIREAAAAQDRATQQEIAALL